MISGRHKDIRAISIERNLSEREIRDAVECISNFRWKGRGRVVPEEAMAIMEAFIGEKMDPRLSCREDGDQGDHSDLFVISETVRKVKERNRDIEITEAIKTSIETSGLMEKASESEKEYAKERIEEEIDKTIRKQEEEDEINIEEDEEENARERHKKGSKKNKKKRGEYGEAPVKRSLMEELQKKLIRGRGWDCKKISQIKEISELIKASPVYASREMKMLRDLRVAEKSLMTKTKNEELSTRVVVDISGSMEESWEKAITIMRIIEKTVREADTYWGGVNIINRENPIPIKEAIEKMRRRGPGGDDDLSVWIEEMTPIMEKDSAKRRNLVIVTDGYTEMEDEEAEDLIDYIEENQINLIIIGARIEGDEECIYLPNEKLERYGISL